MILTASTAAEGGGAGMSAYGASKAAVRAYARAWADELGSRGVRVNAIPPGPVDTPMWDAAFGDRAREKMEALAAGAALLLQGLTAHHFATVSHPVRPGDVALVHAAAGGVGMMLTQIVKARGGTVIGLVSRPEKAGYATDAGADHVLVSSGDAFVEPVRELTGGEGVHVVFDGAGATTFAASLQVLRTHGTMVFYGPLIGDVPTIALNDIPRSTRLTYPVTGDHVRTPEELAARAAELFALVERGEPVVRIGGRYPLAEAARAHADIESRTTTGKLLLIP
ncbi:SDR family oxidoreductase [Streptomyces sp. NPDC059255]|uniref:SDR family oxidoreductase n=1 Tax=Streptomyces sp. NPDC059255 TaxID=3346793 RepID=UPI00369FF8CA